MRNEADFERACAEMMASCACESLRRATRSVTAIYQEALAATGVRAAQLPILVAAAMAGPVPISAMAELLVIDRTTLTRNLAALAKQHLVTIEDADDGRVRLVVLTPQGREALEEALAAWRNAQAAMAAAFGPDRLGSLVSEVGALTDTVRS